ncbi:transcriptional regulator [Herbaspirillum frisingense]|uniref:transcriptional regulator n=1 Tax=Herbaspirillum frisingense TaxID=92645 RepID=UPI0039B0A2EE
MKPLDKAIELSGGVSKLAHLIGVRQSVISNWRARGTLIEPLLCARIERVTKGAITRQHLRPDDWQEIWPELVTVGESLPLFAGATYAVQDVR